MLLKSVPGRCLARAFPDPGNHAKILKMFKESAENGQLGIPVHLDGPNIHVTYQAAILGARCAGALGGRACPAKAGGMTQFGRALHALNIDIICAKFEPGQGSGTRSIAPESEEIQNAEAAGNQIVSGRAFAPSPSPRRG